MIENLGLAPLYAVSFLLVLTTVVTVHELGHFSAAKMFGTAIDRFSIGFGRAIASVKDKAGVEWRLGWIPLGGYVRFGGDSNDASLPDADDLEQLKSQIVAAYGPAAVKRYYHFKPVWQRAIIAVAGPLANFIFAFLIFCLYLLFTAQQALPPIVGRVEAGYPAAAAGFQAGDYILRANGHPLRDFEALTRYVSLRAGDTVTFDVRRGEQVLPLTAKLVRVTGADPLTKMLVRSGRLGVGPDPSKAYWRRTATVQVPAEAMQMVGATIGAPLVYFGRVLVGKENGDQLTGIIGIVNVSGKVAQASLGEKPKAADYGRWAISMILLAATLSVGIGFVNLLPIPILDGGHLMFYAYEAVARRPVAAKIQLASFKVGLALVLCLMLFAARNDLQNMQAFKFLGGLFS